MCRKKLDNKKINLIKNSKKCIFPKRLVHGFRQKFEICQFSIFWKVGEKNVFDDILDRKTAFLD